MQTDSIVFTRLGPNDDTWFDAALDLFAIAFEDPENFSAARPSRGYRKRLLSKDEFILLVAISNQNVVGALAAYELQKFEQERSEFYIYDLAVNEDWRRRGIARTLIARLKSISEENSGSAIYVQTDYEDDAAIALYTALGNREDVIHFDIALD